MVRRDILIRQSWFLGLALFVIALDQFFKAVCLQTLTPGVPQNFIGTFVQLNLVFNDSAAFSIGFGATWIFTIISSIAALVLIWYSFKIKSNSWSIMGGILLGGVSGNLIDRLIRDPGFGIGYVIDYLQIPFNFPVFNLADMAIVSICSLTVIRIMRGDEIGREKRKK